MFEETQKLIGELALSASQKGYVVENLLKTSAGTIFGIQKRGQEGSATIYLSAGIHGDEPAGVLAILELFQEGLFDEFPQFDWLICPLLNPTGLSLGTRENHQGVDLNRDYHKRQTEEVRAHIDWLENQTTPDLFLSLHEDWESSGVYLYEINTQQQPSYSGSLLNAASPFFPREPEMVIDDHLVTQPGWIYHVNEPDLEGQWPEAIWIAKRGCSLSFTFETPSSCDFTKRVECHKVMVREAVKKFAESL